MCVVYVEKKTKGQKKKKRNTLLNTITIDNVNLPDKVTSHTCGGIPSRMPHSLPVSGSIQTSTYFYYLPIQSKRFIADIGRIFTMAGGRVGSTSRQKHTSQSITWRSYHVEKLSRGEAITWRSYHAEKLSRGENR